LDLQKHCQKGRRNVYNFVKVTFAATKHLKTREVGTGHGRLGCME